MIPKIIMQTGRDKVLSKPMQDALDTWKDLNPDYEHHYFDNNACKEFLIEHYNKDVLLAFSLLKLGAAKADFFRYCYLYIMGGIYSDLDNICVKPINEYVDIDQDEFVGILDLPQVRQGKPIDRNGLPIYSHSSVYWIYQAFLASVPNNPIFERLINIITINTLRRVMPDQTWSTWWEIRGDGVTIHMTGPKMMADVVNQYVGRSINTPFTLGILPCHKLKIRFAGSLKGTMMNQEIHNYNDEKIIKVKYEGYNFDGYYGDLDHTREGMYNTQFEVTKKNIGY
jgi:hypothetical protein